MAADSGEPITVRYASRRAEVWAWYWQYWRQKLWRLWAVLAVVIFGNEALSQAQRHSFELSGFVWMGGVVLVAFGAMAAWPMLTFKSQERSLTIHERGLETSVGKRHAERTWRQVASIQDRGEHIVITSAKTGNAFLIPNRAFPSPGLRAEFLDRALRWHQTAH
jgi:hypothetical protein